MNTSLIVSGLAAVALTICGGLLTEVGPWYRGLRKPSSQPPDWLFGPAWTVILGLAAWSASLGWEAARSPGERAVVVGLFLVNALFHLLWSPLFFKFRRPDWALAEVVFLWLSIAALVVWLSPRAPLAAGLLVPYLAWVTFASWLNLMIVRLNAPFGSRWVPDQGG